MTSLGTIVRNNFSMNFIYLNCDEEISEKKIIAAKYATYAVAKMVIILVDD